MNRWRTTTLAVLTSLAVLLTSFGSAGLAADPGLPKYILIMFADGAGPGTFELGRLYHKEVLRKGFITTDTIMAAGNLGLMIHTCADALVCDSAAAATAMFTGFKTNTGMIGVTPNKQPVRNLAEVAKARGYRIGLVSTDAVWDATPGAFSAHAESRRDAPSIAEQYVALEPTIVLGGGRGAFLPKAAGGERADGRDLLAELRARGYSVITTGDELRKVAGGKVFGLFDTGGLSLDLDKDPEEPSYAEMVAAVLRVMKSGQGKFIAMLENENTDAATHDNDLPSTLAALEEFERGVRLAYGFYLAHPKETLLIVTSDHDTGAPGLTYAQRSLSHTASADRVYPTAAHLAMARVARTSVNTASARLGARPTAADLARVMSESYPGLVMHDRYQQHILRNEMVNPALARRIRQGAFGLMLGQYTLVYWGSTGHTSIPVPVAAIGVGAERFRGYMDNTKFAHTLFDLMGGR
ncbi:MAG: alkaline phosphatase [bacterium]|nr:alkaline phosphatase [bacterium]